MSRRSNDLMGKCRAVEKIPGFKLWGLESMKVSLCRTTCLFRLDLGKRMFQGLYNHRTNNICSTKYTIYYTSLCRYGIRIQYIYRSQVFFFEWAFLPDSTNDRKWREVFRYVWQEALTLAFPDNHPHHSPPPKKKKTTSTLISHHSMSSQIAFLPYFRGKADEPEKHKILWILGSL